MEMPNGVFLPIFWGIRQTLFFRSQALGTLRRGHEGPLPYYDGRLTTTLPDWKKAAKSVNHSKNENKYDARNLTAQCF